jgi:hypothetical protein
VGQIFQNLGSQTVQGPTLDVSCTTSFNPLTPNDLKRRCAVSPLKSKDMREKPTNTTIILSVY